MLAYVQVKYIESIHVSMDYTMTSQNFGKINEFAFGGKTIRSRFVIEVESNFENT